MGFLLAQRYTNLAWGKGDNFNVSELTKSSAITVVSRNCFSTGISHEIKNIIKKRMDKNNCKLKILYKCTKANNNSAIWQHMLHISPTKVLFS